MGEVRIMKEGEQHSLLPMTPWFEETFVVRNNNPPVPVLCRAAMRQHLYFATAPGNQRLFISVKKNGVVQQLPVV